MRRWYAALALLLVFLFPFTAVAHSGGTDSNGGHHDGDDYHYHHGYPAHDHWDMDGDGDLDCPHNFDDKTGQNSGSASGGSGVISKPRPSSPLVTQSTTETQSPVEQNNTPFASGELMVNIAPYFAAAIGLLFVMSLFASFFSKRISEICIGLACGILFLGMAVMGLIAVLGWIAAIVARFW